MTLRLWVWLATGGAFSKRQHYTDDEEVVLSAKRPLILNGIDEFVVRGDLASRAIAITLPRIDETERQRERTFWEEFERDKPIIFGALVCAISEALRNQDRLNLRETARMADAWHWVSAAETAFGWETGTCLSAFKKNLAASYKAILDSSSVFPFIERLAAESWAGTATELLTRVTNMRGASKKPPKGWPQDAKSLSGMLRRLSPALRAAAIDVEFRRGHDKIIHIRKLLNFCDASDANGKGVKPASRL